MPFVRQDKWEALRERMSEMGIFEDDLDEKFILGSGRGGQKKNKTANCVYICHLPTGIEVKVQDSRSREVNRYLARRALCEKIEEKEKGIKSERSKKVFKIRKQKARRTRRAKQKMLDEKHKQAKKKELRRRAEPDDEI